MNKGDNMDTVITRYTLETAEGFTLTADIATDREYVDGGREEPSGWEYSDEWDLMAFTLTVPSYCPAPDLVTSLLEKTLGAKEWLENERPERWDLLQKVIKDGTEKEIHAGEVESDEY